MIDLKEIPYPSERGGKVVDEATQAAIRLAYRDRSIQKEEEHDRHTMGIDDNTPVFTALNDGHLSLAQENGAPEAAPKVLAPLIPRGLGQITLKAS